MPLTLTYGDASAIGGFVLVIEMKRFSPVLWKTMETPWMRIWGVMRRSSLESNRGDFGQRGEPETLIPTRSAESDFSGDR
jgi:hypothetical protein